VPKGRGEQRWPREEGGRKKIPEVPKSPAFSLVTLFFGIKVCVFFFIFIENDKTDLRQIFFWM